MLRSLQIRNFAIMDHVDVEFDAGMTVLTGETGAGKSILVDALGLVLGERGSNSLVRTGAARAEFCAEFSLADLPDARSWLEEQTLDQDDDCVLRRIINADGRSRAFINGSAVSLQAMKALGEHLVDIHGQHFHQSLSRTNVQRDLLDHFGNLSAPRLATEAAYAEWQKLAGELRELEAADADRASRLDLLQFQLNELDALDLQPGETESLRNERQILKNSGRLVDGVSAVLQGLFESEGANAQGLLAEACQTLEALCDIDSQLESVLASLREAGIHVGEASDSLRRYAAAIETDPMRSEWVEERLGAIQTVARKHRVEPEELLTVHARIREQLNDLANIDQRSAALARQATIIERSYRDSAAKLSDARRKASANFSAAVTGAMADLGMPGGVFEVAVVDCGEGNEKAHGIDRIEFLISANPGQPLMPLAKVASGGELSRMSLAIQVIASDGSKIPTMVFDEVDSGIGGGVAEMVGRRLKQLGAHCQVLCVTHLPQVASVAHHHFRINKMTDGKSTRTGVAQLGQDERIEEVARMLGGVAITRKTREHAAEMLRIGLSDRGSRKESA